MRFAHKQYNNKLPLFIREVNSYLELLDKNPNNPKFGKLFFLKKERINIVVLD